MEIFLELQTAFISAMVILMAVVIARVAIGYIKHHTTHPHRIPRRNDYPIQWVSDKQREAFMMSYLNDDTRKQKPHDDVLMETLRGLLADANEPTDYDEVVGIDDEGELIFKSDK